MAISFDRALGIHEQALLLREQRTEVLANNLANADTPGFKARDIDFETVLAKQVDAGALPRLFGSNPRHITSMSAVAGDATQVTLSYRVPNQPALDGNTVDEQAEIVAFARNALDHQASFQFLNGKFTGLIKALRGE